MLKIGDKVEVLDDVLSGTITAINGNTVTIETDEGFDLDFNANESFYSNNYIECKKKH